MLDESQNPEPSALSKVLEDAYNQLDEVVAKLKQAGVPLDTIEKRLRSRDAKDSTDDAACSCGQQVEDDYDPLVNSLAVHEDPDSSDQSKI